MARTRHGRAFPAGRCQPSHISLFRRDGGATDLASHLRRQGLVYVGGGSVISLLGTWSAHGVDDMLRAAWEAGLVMTGLSAGSMCWFECGVSTSSGRPEPAAGIGFPPDSNSVHHASEPARRPVHLEAVRTGTVPPGPAADDGAGLLFRGTSLQA